MNLISKLTISEAVARLSEQVDSVPSWLQCIASLNGVYWSGTSPVCGSVNESGFYLRSRQGPGFLIEVVGRFSSSLRGTRVELSSRRSLLAKAFQWTRNSREEVQILEFLQETLRASIDA